RRSPCVSLWYTESAPTETFTLSLHDALPILNEDQSKNLETASSALATSLKSLPKDWKFVSDDDIDVLGKLKHRCRHRSRTSSPLGATLDLSQVRKMQSPNFWIGLRLRSEERRVGKE